MQIIKGEHSGFCFGVKRALSEADKMQGGCNYILGEIIHNESVNKKLADNGLKTISNLDEIELGGGANLLIRTHGEPEITFIKAKELGLNVIDCTCPFVREIQKIVSNHHKDGYKIVIIGKADHPEVIGINGWCDNSALISEDEKEICKISEDKICVVVQTTYSEKKFDNIVKNFTFDKNKLCHYTAKCATHSAQ